MLRSLAIVTMGLLVAGCQEQSNGPRISYEEQQRKQLKKDMDKLQQQANRKIQDNITAGQNAINAAKPRIGR